jgi:RNA polymerase II subunit A C-terminal domain phosphatase
MTHSANGPTVSLEEAQRIERETAQHLLKARKLSLIVDLDQTIVHATVDPTVGEWINEGEAWEVKHAAREAAHRRRDAAGHGSNGGSDNSDSDTDDDDDDDDDDDEECNPNWEALRDVKRFRLAHETFSAPSHRGGSRGRNRSQAINEGCMYYIKPRYVHSWGLELV